jgi:hypothetical protein
MASRGVPSEETRLAGLAEDPAYSLADEAYQPICGQDKGETVVFQPDGDASRTTKGRQPSVTAGPMFSR